MDFSRQAKTITHWKTQPLFIFAKNFDIAGQLLVVDFPMFQQKKFLPFLIRAKGYYLFESHTIHVTSALWKYFKAEIRLMVPWHFLYFLNNNNSM